jgi:hypothetical protein
MLTRCLLKLSAQEWKMEYPTLTLGRLARITLQPPRLFLALKRTLVFPLHKVKLGRSCYAKIVGGTLSGIISGELFFVSNDGTVMPLNFRQ